MKKIPSGHHFFFNFWMLEKKQEAINELQNVIAHMDRETLRISTLTPFPPLVAYKVRYGVEEAIQPCCYHSSRRV